MFKMWKCMEMFLFTVRKSAVFLNHNVLQYKLQQNVSTCGAFLMFERGEVVGCVVSG